MCNSCVLIAHREPVGENCIFNIWVVPPYHGTGVVTFLDLIKSKVETSVPPLGYIWPSPTGKTITACSVLGVNIAP